MTGGTGFIGTNLVSRLEDEGHEVVAGGRSENEGDNFLSLDVTEPETLDFSGFDTVIHLVGLSPLKEPTSSYHEVHVEGTQNVIEACKEADISRYVHLSALGADAEANTEYLRTKGAAQLLVENSDLEWTIFRPSVVFGDGGQFVEFMEGLLTPYVSFLPGGGQTMFQPVYVEDLCDLIAESLEDNRHTGKVYDVGGPEQLSLKEIAEKIERARGRSLKVIPVPMALTRLGFRTASLIGLRYGMDQYRSLKKDNIVEEDALKYFEKSSGELNSLGDYLEDKN